MANISHLEIIPQLNVGLKINKNGFIEKYENVIRVPDQMRLFFKKPASEIPKNENLMFFDTTVKKFFIYKKTYGQLNQTHKYIGSIDLVSCPGNTLQLRLLLSH